MANLIQTHTAEQVERLLVRSCKGLLPGGLHTAAPPP